MPRSSPTEATRAPIPVRTRGIKFMSPQRRRLLLGLPRLQCAIQKCQRTRPAVLTRRLVSLCRTALLGEVGEFRTLRIERLAEHGMSGVGIFQHLDGMREVLGLQSRC